MNEPEIGDVDEGVVEGSEDTSNAENELTCDGGVFVSDGVPQSHAGHAQNQQSRLLTYPHGPGDPRRCSPGQGGWWSSWEAF